MQPTDDSELLRQYAENNSDDAFAALITRHINLVYSVALRRVGNPHHAEEVTQAVFIILAKKVLQLRHDRALSSWLFQATGLTANNFIRSEARRQRREQEAHMQSILNESGGEEAWQLIAPLLDSAVAALNQQERHAIVLRFYEGRNLSEVGAALGASEEAARKRITRALEKMQKFFSRRGVASTPHAIAQTITGNSVQAAPVALIKTVTAVALAKGSTASASTLTLIKGALKLMAWTKVKTTLVISAGILLAAGTATLTLKEITPVSAEDVFLHPADDNYLTKAPPVVILRPSRYPARGMQLDHMHGPPFSIASERFVGLGHSLSWVISTAYDIGPERIILPADLPASTFDLLSAVPNDPKGALRDEIKRQFGLAGHTEIRPRDVFLLRVSNPNAIGLKVNTSKSDDSGINVGAGKLSLINFAMSGLERAFKGNGSTTAVVKTNIDDSIVNVLGGYYLGVPVIDETGLTNSYDIDLQWDGKLKGDDQEKAINGALQEQLGLELVPTNMPIEVLVVEYQDGHQVKPPLPRASWTFAGYDTPETAFQSVLVAMRQGDVKTYLDCLTPDYRKRFEQTDAKGESESVIAGHLKRNATEVTAFQVTSKELLSDDEAILYVRSTRLGNGKVTMKKINGEWKFDEDIH